VSDLVARFFGYDPSRKAIAPVCRPQQAQGRSAPAIETSVTQTRGVPCPATTRLSVILLRTEIDAPRPHRLADTVWPLFDTLRQKRRLRRRSPP
jgi:hypothetical protein